MNRIDSRLVAAIICTLVYLTLFVFNIVHLSRHFELPTQYNLNDSSDGTPGKHSLMTGGGLGSQGTLSHSTWFFQLPGHLTSIILRSPPHFDIGTTSIGSGTQRILIGGSWGNNLICLEAGNLNLSSMVTFTSPSPTTMDEISPSTNGYLNSRIDLRRRRRAFAVTSGDIVPPSIRLQLREDVVLQPRNVDPSMLRQEFEKALARNRRLKEALATRKLRKGRKKKGIKVNSTR
ncbi:hypothetical protein B0J17DRAFT_318025 [Rhizoctonia solani]|nr:hypothetical protein B0J17DRAFT_318025 [Rhizoctonia solani]